MAMANTTNARIDPPAATECGESASDGPDLWYTVTGTGYNMTATLCESAITWDSQLALYAGTNCGDLTCVAFEDDTCGGAGHAEITWASVEGQKYFLRVFGWDYQMGVYGPFSLKISDDSPQPQGCPGDYDCSGAIDFFDIDLLLAALGGEQSWSTKYQEKFGTTPPCGDCNLPSRGCLTAVLAPRRWRRVGVAAATLETYFSSMTSVGVRSNPVVGSPSAVFRER